MNSLDFKNGDLLDLSHDVLLIGEELIERLHLLHKIDGVQKLQRKIMQELKFLKKAKEKKTLKVNQLMCSNLIHYEYFVEVLTNQQGVIHVDYIFSREENENPLRVDIVCENGCKWIKVIARNSKSLNDAATGRASFGAKSVIDQAKEYINAASKHHYMYRPPKVTFYFRHDVDKEFSYALKNMGVDIYTTVNKNVCHPDVYSLDVNVLNIDVSTMIAFVSALTNGSANWLYQEEILTSQGRAERSFPIKSVLEKLFEGKRLICCETAAKSFQDIIALLGGSQEKERAEKFLRTIEICADITEIPSELSALKLGGKIKERSFKIFAFGFVMKAVTVSSNEGFIRSAKMQGIDVPAFVHQARALTEQKEQYASPLCDKKNRDLQT